MSTETDAVTPDRQEANRRYAEQFNEAARIACTTYLDGIGTWGPVRKAQEFDALDAAGQTVWRAVADRAAHAMPARPDVGGAPMTDATPARFTVHMAPSVAGVPLVGGGGCFNILAVSAVEAGVQVRAQLAGVSTAKGWLPWSVRDSASEEVWHFTDGPLEEKR